MAGEKILVVDDEEHIQELIKFNLEKSGFRVICTGNGIDAVKIVKEQFPQLMLLDLMLPGMNGLDVSKEIRKDSVMSNMPIIMITAMGEEIDKIIGLELGANASNLTQN